MNDAPKHLTIRISPKLRAAIQAYAKRHDTNVSQLTLEFYRRLLAEELPQEAEQI